MATHGPLHLLRGRRLLSRSRGPLLPSSPPPVTAASAIAQHPSRTHRGLRAPPPPRPGGEGVAVPRQGAARPERRPAQAAPVPDLLSAWLATQRRTTNLLSSQWLPPPAPDRTRPSANGRAAARPPCPIAAQQSGSARPPVRELIPGRPCGDSQSQRRLGALVPPPSRGRSRWAAGGRVRGSEAWGRGPGCGVRSCRAGSCVWPPVPAGSRRGAAAAASPRQRPLGAVCASLLLGLAPASASVVGRLPWP